MRTWENMPTFSWQTKSKHVNIDLGSFVKLKYPQFGQIAGITKVTIGLQLSFWIYHNLGVTN